MPGEIRRSQNVEFISRTSAKEWTRNRQPCLETQVTVKANRLSLSALIKIRTIVGFSATGAKTRCSARLSRHESCAITRQNRARRNGGQPMSCLSGNRRLTFTQKIDPVFLR